MKKRNKISFGIADDHALFRKGLVSFLLTNENYEALYDVSDGREVIQKCNSHIIPDILILDVNMLDLNGKETSAWVSNNFPEVKIIALSMYNDEKTILEMTQAGAMGYITKACDPSVIMQTIDKLCENDFYLPPKHTERAQKNYCLETQKSIKLNDNEKSFLFYLCQELTYFEIAEKMFLSPRTIHDYSKNLTMKLNVRNKSGLIVYAINNSLNVSPKII